MNILLLDDQGSIAVFLAELLVKDGHTVFSAYSILDADCYLEENEIDCIIADLNLPVNGLSEEQIVTSRDGMLSGWVWLTDKVFPEYIKLRTNTIIFSDYLNDIDQSISNDNYKSVILIEKRSYDSIEKLLTSIKNIANNIQSEL